MDLRKDILRGGLPRYKECFIIALKWLKRKYKHVSQKVVTATWEDLEHMKAQTCGETVLNNQSIIID